MMIRRPIAFRQLATLYSIAYLFAVAADHLSTLYFLSQGQSEGNVLFTNAEGEFLETRAIVVFIAIWPAMIWMLHVGWSRIANPSYRQSFVLRPFLGRTSVSALAFPITLVIVKVLAGLLNTIETIFNLQSAARIREILQGIGAGFEGSGVLVVALTILTVAVIAARRIAVAIVTLHQ